MTSPEKTVLVLQHVRCEPPAAYEDVLIEQGFTVDRVLLDEGQSLPAYRNYAAVIVMGGPMGAVDDDTHAWLPVERAYIAAAVSEGLPFWGVCLGARLLAASLGAQVTTGPTPEVGMYDIRLTDDAAADPVLGRSVSRAGFPMAR